MSQTPEAPLLSPERLAEIRAQLEVPRARNSYVTDYGVAADVVEELYNHALAFRQQVAAELAGLLADLTPDATDKNNTNYIFFDKGWIAASEERNTVICAAAARLGIELPR